MELILYKYNTNLYISNKIMGWKQDKNTITAAKIVKLNEKIVH